MHDAPKARLNTQKGLTIVEVLIAVLILLPLFTLGMQAVIQCVELSDSARNSSLAVWGVKNRMAAIENTAFDQIYGTYNNTTFMIPGMTGLGKTYVDNSDSDHLIIKIAFSWEDRNGRIFGEDKNLNGTLDSGEDNNNNGQIDSIVQIVTQISDI